MRFRPLGFESMRSNDPRRELAGTLIVSQSTSVPVSGPPVVEVRGLGKRFAATLALDDVSVPFYAGEIHCVLGENGAGKSTLGKIIGGVHLKDFGDVLVDGNKVEIHGIADARRLGISVVHQDLSLAPDLSIRANLLLATETRRHPFARLPHALERARVQPILDKLQLRVDMEQRVCDLPVATQQMLEVAKALIRRPRMIVLDEPTAMLSELDKRQLFAVLRTLRNDGAALAFITHHIEDVNAVADRISILRNGRLVDSFKLTGAFDSDEMLEKLSGKPIAPQNRATHRTSGSTLLQIDGLRDQSGQPASVNIARGEILGLYGVVGCGAEHIARLLVGLERRSGLTARMDGVPLDLRDPAQALQRGIAYLASGRARNGILPTRSIRENLNLSALDRYARTGIVSRRRERAGTQAQLKASAVKFVDSEDTITVLSGGNQQKILVSRSLAGARHVLVLEDPTAGIDIGSKLEIHEAIRARARGGLAVVLISSDLIETILMADTLYTLFAGTIVHRYEKPTLDDQGAIVADVTGQSRPAMTESKTLIPGADT